MNLLNHIIRKIIGSQNDRVIKQLQKKIIAINQLESVWQSLSDEALQYKTIEFKERLKAGVSLDDLIPEAFATVREASARVLDMRHFDVQLIGGLVLHQGKIAEMRTGEGKTLVATLAAYLNALMGQGVHIVTVNDYLAKRDAHWMKPIYQFLGLTVGVVLEGLTMPEKRKAYAADITYGTNSRFGFDYLEDNMAMSLEHQVQRPLHYAIIDEVDSILIDEARTPLIISGAGEDSSENYYHINQIIPVFEKGEHADFTTDEKTRQAHLTEKGHEKLEKQLVITGLLKETDNLYSAEHINLMYHFAAALKAHHLFRRDVDYIIQANQVVIVDEHTGRLMFGKRWSEGLHQAVEAKEKLNIQAESQTQATITFQNYFRLYKKLSGMTGTAETEAYELHHIYGLEVIVIPTHQPVHRVDLPDKVYLTREEKWQAITADIEAMQEKGQPVLVGTASVEHSELLSQRLQRKGVKHQVLNAKQHAKEASIIAEAGRLKTVTIATNMAGRGTDIILGGNLKAELAALGPVIEEKTQYTYQEQWKNRRDQVVSAGGLYTLSSERHESRRVDNQFRGRGGRQGDPGFSRFYLSAEDDLLRIFGGERLISMMKRLGMKQGESIEHRWVTRAIENAQRQVENHHFDVRKQLLEYDDVANEQRKIIYRQRQAILLMEDTSEILEHFWYETCESIVLQYFLDETTKVYWNFRGLQHDLKENFQLHLSIEPWVVTADSRAVIVEKIVTAAKESYQTRCHALSSSQVAQFEKTVLLQTIDDLWKDHIGLLDHLKQGIALRGFAQKNPKQEYKIEAFKLFENLLYRLKYQVIHVLCAFDLSVIRENKAKENYSKLNTGYSMVGRNEICPCGSKKKFKHCHGKLN